MPSNVMLRLLMTDWSDCALRFAVTRLIRAPTDISMTTANRPTATIISTRVKPRTRDAFVFVRNAAFGALLRLFDFLVSRVWTVESVREGVSCEGVKPEDIVERFLSARINIRNLYDEMHVF